MRASRGLTTNFGCQPPAFYSVYALNFNDDSREKGKIITPVIPLWIEMGTLDFISFCSFNVLRRPIFLGVFSIVKKLILFVLKIIIHFLTIV